MGRAKRKKRSPEARGNRTKSGYVDSRQYNADICRKLMVKSRDKRTDSRIKGWGK